MRILATTSNVEHLFEKSSMPYVYTDGGVEKTVQVEGWKCRTCGWQSLMGLKGLPFPHECSPIMAIAEVIQRFEG